MTTNRLYRNQTKKYDSYLFSENEQNDSIYSAICFLFVTKDGKLSGEKPFWEVSL